MEQNEIDDLADLCINSFLALPKSFHPSPRSNGTPQFCILAGFVLASTDGLRKCISIGTGSKCLPGDRLSPNGDVLHDSHAEVLARRGAVRWLYEEIVRSLDKSYNSNWIERDGDGIFSLREDITVTMYVSTLPCGDASMLSLSLSQDPKIAAMKALSPFLPSSAGAIRGRNGYDIAGALRTKPGRADSIPTLSMSCSDKIASWTVLGIQGALLSRWMAPVYIDQLVIGEVAASAKPAILAECERAFKTRMSTQLAFTMPYHQHAPKLGLAPRKFAFSLPETQESPEVKPVAATESVVWTEGLVCEALVSGIRRGATRKTPSKASRSMVSKAVLLDLDNQLRVMLGDQPTDGTYFDAKQTALAYQSTKRAVRSEGGPLHGWIVSGEPYEGFKSANSPIHIH